MELFDVYPLFDIEPVKAQGCFLWDKNETKYLDLYGGHAVISIGHSHPHYVKKITEQLQHIGYYSNSVKISLQQELADKLGALSGYNDYQLFLCNSGAEANENALKLASFHNKRKRIIAFSKSFHGRTSLTVAATDDKTIQAPVNENPYVMFLQFNNIEALHDEDGDDAAAVIVEGIQGVGGVNVPSTEFLQGIRTWCDHHGAVMIADEIQSGCGRTGKFFAHQYSNVKPDIITIAKGMGNGFPVAGVLISPDIKPKHGMLGTTFGGNHLACAAAIAVLDVMKNERLIQNATDMGSYLFNKLAGFEHIKEIRGKGLMIGIELEQNAAVIRNGLLLKHKMLTGSSSNKNTIRILPPLCIKKEDANLFIRSFENELQQVLTVA